MFTLAEWRLISGRGGAPERGGGGVDVKLQHATFYNVL